MKLKEPCEQTWKKKSSLLFFFRISLLRNFIKYEYDNFFIICFGHLWACKTK